jgi:excisionase family DNA binding protein
MDEHPAGRDSLEILEKPKFVSLMEAAFFLGVPYDTARRLLLTHKLEGCRLGKHWLVDRASLTRYQETMKP